jgi:UDP-N-acetylglucosamine acyltransferase
MPSIHPTAVVDPGATIADNVEIGPYCIVGPHVELRQGCRLGPHVHLAGHTIIGARTVVAPFASLGTPPQSVRYRGGPTRLVIGEDCDIRESVTINTGTEDGGGLTEIGNRCFFLVGSHVGHDCRVGDDVVFANNAVLGGHVTVGSHVFLGGQCAVHQHVRVGEGAMISGLSGVACDLIPFGVAIGSYAFLHGLNVIGMRRRGYSRADMRRVRRVYRALFHGPGLFRDRVAAAAVEFAADPVVGKVVEFVQGGATRPLMMPSDRSTAGGMAGATP